MIKVIDNNKAKQKMVFSIEMPISLANAIRRSTLEIPIMAIDEVEIVNNDSALYDEIIAHRLGLVPIKTEKALKDIKFRIRAKGPKTVYSSDIEPSIGNSLKIPITVLDSEQELEIVAEAKLGKGIEHIKYSPGLVYFKHNIDEDILDYVNVDENGKVNFNEDELKDLNISEELLKKIKKLDKATELVFTIESWGQIEPKDIFLKAIDALDQNLEDLNKAID